MRLKAQTCVAHTWEYCMQWHRTRVKDIPVCLNRTMYECLPAIGAEVRIDIEAVHHYGFWDLR